MSGSGTQYNAQGEYVAQGSAQQFNSAGGAMHFGSRKDESEACLASLFLTDPRDDREQLIQTKGSRVVGTCEWIKSNKLFNSWLHSRSHLLWLSGGPGKGKTMLSIFLAEELEQTARHSQDILLLQYFCDNKDEKRNTAITIIRGLIFQLLQSREKLFDYILPSFKIQRESLFTGSSFQTLWKIFESMVRDPVLGTTYCVLDGLDECDEASLEVLLRKFAALLSVKTNKSSVCHLNLIVVSRDFPDLIPELLSSFPRIRLDPDADTEINNDIDQFIEVKVDELSEYKKYPKPLCVHVKEVFRNRAQGTFLWVGIVTKSLERYKATEVENALDLFPPGLNELFARMLLQIDIGRRDIAAKILRWVVMAVRPLTLSELSIAIDTCASSSFFSRGEVIRDQLSYCGHFLAIREDKKVVSLIHQSAKDYLLRKNRDLNPVLEFFRIKEEAVNLEIARKCFNYLQNGALAAGKVDLYADTSHLRAFPLLSYAAIHWPEHAKSLAPSEDIFDLSLFFYSKKSPIRESWLKTYWAAKKFGPPPKPFTLLHLASCFGILPLAENLLFKKDLINKGKSELDLALIWAAQGGHEALGQLLLKKGADVNAKDKDRETALYKATKDGHKGMVRLLLENGADVNAKDERGKMALHLAYRGHEAVVRLLLEKGADVNAKNRSEETALSGAAWGGQEAVVRLLLEKGADVNARNEYRGTALNQAAEGGHETVVRLLLEKGADVNAKKTFGGTALNQAAEGGHEAMVRLLLEKGADVNAKNRSEETALHSAAADGHEGVVWLLLEKGADVNARNEYRETALYQAAEGGHEAMVRLLLEKGADVNAKKTFGGTALYQAAMCGHEAVVRLLLEKGADVNAKKTFGGTALYQAAMCGHEAVVRLLLEKGADITAKSRSEETALHSAARRGHWAVVRLLLEKGADVNAVERDGQTALHLAARGGHEAVVRLLLEKGAGLKAKSYDGQTAIDKATRAGHGGMVRLLSEKGARR